MGNLGSYQDIVTEAHRLGGVEQLIESIEKAATTRAVPRAFASGAVATAVLALGVAAAARAWSKRVARHEAEAEDAKVRLTDVIDEPTPPSTESEANADESPSTSGTPGAAS